MADKIQISVRARSGASRHDVFSLLSDSSTWSRWSPFSQATLVEQAPGGGEGPGAVRQTRYRGAPGREKVLSLVPDRQMSYSYLKGALSLYVRDYVGVVDLDDPPDGTGTEIHWHSTFSSRFPGSGAVARAILKRFLQRCADGLADAARQPVQKDVTPDG